MAIQRFRKDPHAVLDYGFDWETDPDPNDDEVGPWLDVDGGETISTTTWTVPTGITKDSDEKGDGTAKIWLSGGTAGESYIIACKIVTSASRTDERSFEVIVADR